jgi:hypothetical protein
MCKRDRTGEYNSEKYKEWYKNNKEKVLQKQKKWNDANKQHTRQYREVNKEEIREKRLEYIRINKKKISDYSIKHARERYNSDPNYKQKRTIVNLTRNCLVTYKHSYFEYYLGCSILEFKEHIESLFKPDMNFENYGKIWWIDHIIPLSSFDLTDEEQKLEACNYKNIQPLYVKENQYKSDKVNGVRMSKSSNINKIQPLECSASCINAITVGRSASIRVSFNGINKAVAYRCHNASVNMTFKPYASIFNQK